MPAASPSHPPPAVQRALRALLLALAVVFAATTLTHSACSRVLERSLARTARDPRGHHLVPTMQVDRSVDGPGARSKVGS